MHHGVVHGLWAAAIFGGVFLLRRSACAERARDAEGARRDAAFSAAGAAIFFFCGREFRDYEKLGEWDWVGLFAPIAVALVLALVVLPGRAWWETRVRSTLCAATHGGSAVSL